MARLIVRIEKVGDIPGLVDLLPLTVNQVYDFIHRPQHPLPHKKIGKVLMFDMETVYQWWEGLPGRNDTMPDFGKLFALRTGRKREAAGR